MFENVSNLAEVIENVYLKMKYYVFHDKTLMHIKRRISDFEKDNQCKKVFRIIAEKLSKKEKKYFFSLIETIDFVVKPKKYVSGKDRKLVRSGNVEDDKKISNINFFIDGSIELFIVDFFWMLLIKKISLSHIDLKNSYAGQFKNIFLNDKMDLISGIDFCSNRCFQSYFHNYRKWKKDCLKKIEEDCIINNIVLFSLDLKSFYYNANFHFKDLNDIFDHDSRLKEIEFLSGVVEQVYFRYSRIISDIKKDVCQDPQSTILPLGLFSPLVLRDFFLIDFDERLRERLNPQFYGRYVDDILICVKDGEDCDESYYFEKYFIDSKIFKKDLNNEKTSLYVFSSNDNIKLELNEKIKFFYFKKGTEPTVIKAYGEVLKKYSSEANLLPDTDFFESRFALSVNETFFKNTEDSLQDFLPISSNSFSATMFIQSVIRLIRNCEIDDESRYVINKYVKEIKSFYKGSQSLEFCSTWPTIFELFLLLNDKDSFLRFFKEQLDFSEKIQLSSFENDLLNDYEKRRKVLEKLKSEIRQSLLTSAAIALALNPTFFGDLSLTDEDVNTMQSMAKMFRKANLFNEGLTTIPLINHLTIMHSDISFINPDLYYYFNKMNTFKISIKKIKYSPNFVKLEDIAILNFINSVSEGNKNIVSVKKTYDLYHRINNISYKGTLPLVQARRLHNSIYNTEYTYRDGNEEEINIGLVSVSIKPENVFEQARDSQYLLNVKNKQDIIRTMNSAVQEKVNFVVFPEFFFPLQWIRDIFSLSKNTNITVITGMRYIVNGSRVHNFSCVLKSFQVNNFKYLFPIFREKNFYPPDEKIGLLKMDLQCKNPTRVTYSIFNNSKFRFSEMLCYEMTDIYSRCNFKNKLNVLFIPQLNRDTHYFSSIVESTARDLYIYMIQSNTANYGDSRITGPFKNDSKDMVRIKGGDNQYIATNKIYIEKDFFQARRDYENDFINRIKACKGCVNNKKSTNFISHLHDECSHCPNFKKFDLIKPPPPN